MTRPPTRKPAKVTPAPALPAKAATAKTDVKTKTNTKTNGKVATVRGKPPYAVPTSSAALTPAVPAAWNRPAAKPGVRPGGRRAKAAASPNVPSL